jgi:hypothetical protein
LQNYFDAEFTLGPYSQVALADVSDKVSFGAAIKNVTGITHIAVNTQLPPNPEPYIPQNGVDGRSSINVCQIRGSDIFFYCRCGARRKWQDIKRCVQRRVHQTCLVLVFRSSLQNVFRVCCNESGSGESSLEVCTGTGGEASLHCKYNPTELQLRPFTSLREARTPFGVWVNAFYNGNLSTISSVLNASQNRSRRTRVEEISPCNVCLSDQHYRATLTFHIHI